MEVAVSKGFLVLAQNTQKTDYVKQAYALALSIKATQCSVTSISLVTNDVVPDEYKSVFDNIIDIPFADIAYNEEWKIENRWKLYHASPYDETIVLDTDMLFLEDISSWWDYCSNSDLKFCRTVKNYKNEVIEKDTYNRNAFLENNLPNCYVALHYFRQSDFAHEFFKTLEFVCLNWEYCYKQFTPNKMQNWLSLDMASAIAIKMLGIEEVVDKASPLEFVHMKPGIQNIRPIPSSWQNVLDCEFSKSGLVVGNYKQHKLFHYVEKDFLTDEIIFTLQELVHDRV